MIVSESEAWRIVEAHRAPGEPLWMVVGGVRYPRVAPELDARKVIGLVGTVAVAAVAAAVVPLDEIPDTEIGYERILALTPHRLLVVHVHAAPRALARPEIRVNSVGRFTPDEIARLVERVDEERRFLVSTVNFTLREPGEGERVVCTTSDGWRDNLGQARALAARLNALLAKV